MTVPSKRDFFEREKWAGEVCWDEVGIGARNSCILRLSSPRLVRSGCWASVYLVSAFVWDGMVAVCSGCLLLCSDSNPSLDSSTIWFTMT